MLVLVTTDNHIQGSEGLQDHVQSTLEASLQRYGDRITRVGSTPWAGFQPDDRLLAFKEVVPGETVSIEVLREGMQRSIAWRVPGPTLREVLARLVRGWWLPYPFWLAGTALYLFLRPRNLSWRLLIASSLLTAVWLSSAYVAPWQMGFSTVVFRCAIWLALPVYLHLHWNFPHPLHPLPRPRR